VGKELLRLVSLQLKMASKAIKAKERIVWVLFGPEIKKYIENK
jgi:hypothetical protein